jgi:hypothetical protein
VKVISDEEPLLSKSRSSSPSGVETIGQHLQHLSEKSRGSSFCCVVGGKDYEPVEGESLSVSEWEELEMTAAMGTRGTLHENFRRSIQVMDQYSDNSSMPFTVVNGRSLAAEHLMLNVSISVTESVAVGVVLKNPLKGVPLLMTNLCLVWEATPTLTPTPSSPSPSVAAVCEVVDRVLLQPEEEKMVSGLPPLSLPVVNITPPAHCPILQVTLHITPLKEGELEVKGFIFNLCMESNISGKSSSPLNAGGHRANSLALGGILSTRLQ